MNVILKKENGVDGGVLIDKNDVLPERMSFCMG